MVAKEICLMAKEVRLQSFLCVVHTTHGREWRKGSLVEIIDGSLCKVREIPTKK